MSRPNEDSITVTIERADAWCLVLAPLDYTVESNMRRTVPKGGSTMRIRQSLARELGASWELDDNGVRVLCIDGKRTEEGALDA